MKIIITESQYWRLIESEEEGFKLYNFTKLYKSYKNDPNMWDEIFEQKNRLNIKNGGKKYDGYYIDGSVDLRKSKDITELKYLVKVGGFLNLNETPITELLMLSTVGGYLDLSGSQITELPMLSKVGGSLDLYKTPITELPMLSTVGGYLDLRNDLLGEELKKTMSKEEIKNKFGVKGDLYI